MAADLIYALLALAFAGAVQGAWMTVRGLTTDSALARRLAPRQPAKAAPDEAAAREGRLARLLDARLPWLRGKLVAARAPFTPVQVVAGSLGLTVAFVTLLRVLHIPWPVAISAALWGGAAGPVLLVSALAARRRRLFLTQMPQAVDLIARSLQAGHPVTTAMSIVAEQMPDPIGPEFGVVIAEMRHGLDRDAALRNLLRRFPIPELRMFAASLEVTRETGGNLAEVFLKLGEAIRGKAQLRLKVRAISAEGRLTFWVVAGLPVVVGGSIALLNPDYYRAVAKDPLFLPLMCEPPLLLTIGAAIIWRMVNFEI